MTKGQERHPAVFGFDLYRLVSGLFRLFKPDVRRRLDDLGHVGVESAADDDFNAGLATFVGTDADERATGKFSPDHLCRDQALPS